MVSDHTPSVQFEGMSPDLRVMLRIREMLRLWGYAPITYDEELQPSSAGADPSSRA